MVAPPTGPSNASREQSKGRAQEGMSKKRGHYRI
jgi:hypothetical protein